MRPSPRHAAPALLAAVLAAGGAAAPAGAQPHIAVVYAGSKLDGGFNEAAYRGLQKAQAEFPIQVREAVAAEAERRRRLLKRFAAAGSDHLIALGVQSRPAVRAAAQARPEAKFTLIDAAVKRPNVRSVTFREDQAGYLVGVAAGHASQAGHVGFIAGMPIAPVRDYGCGFAQGVRAVAPQADIAWATIGDRPTAFRNTGRAARLARRQIAAGADIVFPAAGFASQGALQAVAASGKALGIGVDVNQNGRYPDALLTSAIKRIDRAVFLTVQAAVTGTWSPGRVELGLAENAVGWAVDKHNRQRVAPFKDRVEAARQKLAAGTIALDGPADLAACS